MVARSVIAVSGSLWIRAAAEVSRIPSSNNRENQLKTFHVPTDPFHYVTISILAGHAIVQPALQALPR